MLEALLVHELADRTKIVRANHFDDVVGVVVRINRLFVSQTFGSRHATRGYAAATVTAAAAADAAADDVNVHVVRVGVRCVHVRVDVGLLRDRGRRRRRQHRLYLTLHK